MLYKVDEDAKVYYVVMDRGEDFPPPPVGSMIIPPLTSDEAKLAIINGVTGISKRLWYSKIRSRRKIKCN